MQGNKDFSRDEKKKTRIIIDVGFCLHNSLVKSVVGQTYDRVSFLQSACMGKYPCPPEFGLSNSPFSFDDFDIKRGFLGQETICGHGCHEICGKSSDAPVARVFNLNDVLQFVVYRLDQRPFPQ